MLKTARRAIGLTLGAALLALTGCTTVTPKPITSYTPPAAPSSLPGPRPTELQKTPVVNPCLLSPATAWKITGNQRLFLYDKGPYYMPTKLLNPGEVPFWICRYAWRLSKPVDGMDVYTYDTTSSPAAQRKYQEVSRTFYNSSSLYTRVQQPSSFLPEADRSFLLHCASVQYCGVGVLIGKTVLVITWDEDTESPVVLRRLAKAAIAALPPGSK